MADPMAPPAPAAPADPMAKRQQFLQNKRDEVQRQANQGLQQNNDAIARRFAALGASGSGAQIAAGLKAQDQAAAQQRQGMADVDAQELQMQEGDINRAFQSGEAQKQRDFQGGQFDKTFGLQQGAQRMAEQQAINDQLDNQFNTLQNLYDRGVGVDLGAFLTNRYGAYGRGNESTDALSRRLAQLRGAS